MKKILLWDPRFPDRKPLRLTVADLLASAAVRAGVAAAADPAEHGALAVGGALDPGSLTDVVLEHGVGRTLTRLKLPLSVAAVGVTAGVVAPVGAPIVVALPANPVLSLSSAVTLAEGNTGTASFVWTLTLNRDGSTASFPYTYAVTGLTADAADFGGTFPSGSGTFAPGETSKTITVLVTGDTAVEPAEAFLLTVTAAGLVSVTSTGTISNDDGVPLNALTLGTPTYRDTMQSGDVVASIGGATAGASINMTGAAFTGGFLDINLAGTAVIIGTLGGQPGGTSTGAFSLVETKAGASNSPRTTAFGALTSTQNFYAVDTSTTAYSRTANGQLDGVGTRDQFVLVSLFRLDALPAAERTIFGALSSDTTSVAPRIRVGSTGAISGSAVTTAYFARCGLANVGQWHTAFVQMNVGNGNGSGLGDRSRGWLDGSRGSTTASMGAATTISTDRFFGFETATGSTTVDHRQAFHWLWWGNAAECGLIDFDNPVAREAFSRDNLNPTTGTVTLPLVGGGTVTLTPKGFFHGTAAEWTAGIANKGAATPSVTLSKIAGTYTDTNFATEVISIGNPATVSQVSFNQNDATYNFPSAKTGAQFADLSWWADNSAGTALTITPESIQGVRPIAGAGALTSNTNTPSLRYHGAMMNPGNSTDVAAYPSGTSPYDGSLQGFDEFDTEEDAAHVLYASALNIDPGKTGSPITATTGSVVKFISRTTATRDGSSMGQSAAVLTLLNGTPPTAAPDLYFRPPISNPTKDLWILANDANLNLSGFPSLSAVASTPSFFEVYNSLKNLHTTWHLNHRNSDNISVGSFEAKYGRDYAKYTGWACLLMCLASTTTAQRIAMARALTQIGIDYTGMYEQGRRNTASGLGSTSQGRKITLAVAALVTGNSRILAASQAENWLAEQRAMVQITSGMTSRTDPLSRYPASLIGSYEWNVNAEVEVDGPHLPTPYWTKEDYNTAYGLPTTERNPAEYRHNWGSTMFAHYCAMKAVSGLAAAANWPGFINYMQRYWTEEGTRGFNGDGTYSISKPIGVFAKNFRQTHTSHFP